MKNRRAYILGFLEIDKTKLVMVGGKAATAGLAFFNHFLYVPSPMLFKQF
jgi:hypothetical protein